MQGNDLRPNQKTPGFMAEIRNVQDSDAANEGGYRIKNVSSKLLDILLGPISDQSSFFRAQKEELTVHNPTPSHPSPFCESMSLQPYYAPY